MTNPTIDPLITMPGGAEWLVILVIVIIIFGAAKLPELARGTGQALRIFKAETKGLVDGDDDEEAQKQPRDPSASRAELPPTREDLPTTSETPADKHQADKHQG